jgi:hypothetical protein
MPETRSAMILGENISVSDEAIASSSGRSRTKCTYASTANLVAGSTPSVEIT